ncbi:MAG TPA: DUF922 domain-containing protein [Verrucomicrobiae bacterium]|nr:DUF922 domain-containing protein [Verrucomicrobiae bacterium]
MELSYSLPMAESRIFVLFWLCAASACGQHVSCRTNYYPVTGSDLREIHQSFRMARPWRETSGHDGFTVWNVNWRFNTFYNGSVCRVSGFSTTTTIAITLPRWVMPTNATDSLKAEWTRYIKALGQHEYGHAQLALAAAGEIQKQIRGVGDDSSCDSLKQRVGSLCEGIIRKYKDFDAAYDERTNHGLNDGALLGRRERPRPPPE